MQGKSGFILFEGKEYFLLNTKAKTRGKAVQANQRQLGTFSSAGSCRGLVNPICDQQARKIAAIYVTFEARLSQGEN